MAKQDKSTRSGFVIKLSTQTAQKLADEEQLAKTKAKEAASITKEVSKIETEEENVKQVTSQDVKQNINLEVSPLTGTDKSDKSETEKREPKPDKEQNPIKDSEKLENDNSTSKETSWGDYAPYITYEGEEAIYTDPTTKQRYVWSNDSNSWVTKDSEAPGRKYSYENDTHVYTDADGSKCFWDDDKKAWLPKVDDDFLAIYQMSYGFVDNRAEDKKDEKKEQKAKEVQNKSDNPTGVKRKNDPQWFQPTEEKNTKVYVSNLPLDLTEEEFVNFMQKCGLVERDPHTQKMKVKLYMDKEQNCFKGDALCTYIKIESVDLALNLLDGYDLRGNKIKVERAFFELKGEYNPALKPKKKRKKELEKIKKMQQKLFDWRPEKFIGERSKHERVVIIKNLFHPTDFDKEVQLILDYQQDLREESSKCGEVRKVVLYDRHPEGVAQITMKEPEQADAVIELINGRWFGKRQITAEIWDGRTKYRIAETDADIGKRMDKWEKFLEEKDDKKQDEKKDSTVDGAEATATTSEELKNVNPEDTESETAPAMDVESTTANEPGEKLDESESEAVVSSSTD